MAPPPAPVRKNPPWSGHLAALLGLAATRDEPGSVAASWTGTDPRTMTTMAAQARPDAVARADAPDSRESQLIGAPPQDFPERARAASPVAHVHGSAPPFLLAHGTADRFVPAAQSRQLADALRRAGVDVELDLVPGADHLWRHAAEPGTILARALDFATSRTR